MIYTTRYDTECLYRPVSLVKFISHRVSASKLLSKHVRLTLWIPKRNGKIKLIIIIYLEKTRRASLEEEKK